jgi:hypothetical protein
MHSVVLPVCLRDYSNMAYHALLDWRLAGELLTVVRHGKLDVDLSGERTVLDKWATAYGAACSPAAPRLWQYWKTTPSTARVRSSHGTP